MGLGKGCPWRIWEFLKGDSICSYPYVVGSEFQRPLGRAPHDPQVAGKQVCKNLQATAAKDFADNRRLLLKDFSRTLGSAWRLSELLWLRER